MCQEEPSLWVFGYGSLIWRTGFNYVAKLNGYIRGFDRKFRQISTRHRGTECFPGRVVTLLESHDESTMVHGTAFCIPGADVPHVMAALDEREAGYSRVWTTMYIGEDLPALQVIVYVGNESQVQPETDEFSLARIIACARGRAGPNSDYLFLLSEHLRARRVHDHHVETLCHLVRTIQEEQNIRYAMSYLTETKGIIYVSSQAAMSVSNCGSAIYSCGILLVEGEFSRDSIIEIKSRRGESIAKGSCNFSSSELQVIKGQSREVVPKLLGSENAPEVVISTEMMVLC